jgi:hypothetical protein
MSVMFFYVTGVMAKIRINGELEAAIKKAAAADTPRTSRSSALSTIIPQG